MELRQEAPDGAVSEERMLKETIRKEDGRLLTYYRFVPAEAAEKDA